jgi:hypothetical protein
MSTDRTPSKSVQSLLDLIGEGITEDHLFNSVVEMKDTALGAVNFALGAAIADYAESEKGYRRALNTLIRASQREIAFLDNGFNNTAQSIVSDADKVSDYSTKMQAAVSEIETLVRIRNTF